MLPFSSDQQASFDAAVRAIAGRHSPVAVSHRPLQTGDAHSDGTSKDDSEGDGGESSSGGIAVTLATVEAHVAELYRARRELLRQAGVVVRTR